MDRKILDELVQMSKRLKELHEQGVSADVEHEVIFLNTGAFVEFFGKCAQSEGVMAATYQGVKFITITAE